MSKKIFIPFLNLCFNCTVMIFCVSFIIIQLYNFNKLITPVYPNQVESKQIKLIKSDLRFLGAKEKDLNKLSHAIKYASDITKINDLILTPLMYTESNFKLHSISSKGYKSLMQTPIADYEHDLDTIRGAKILQEKLRYAKGDLKLALALYKGGNNPAAKKYAAQTLKWIDKLKKRRIENG